MDTGSTVVVIEHDLEVIKTADWIIDLGPEGGDGGGRIVTTGPPEDVAANAATHTSRFLAPLLSGREARPSHAAASAPERLPNACSQANAARPSNAMRVRARIY